MKAIALHDTELAIEGIPVLKKDQCVISQAELPTIAQIDGIVMNEYMSNLCKCFKLQYNHHQHVFQLILYNM